MYEQHFGLKKRPFSVKATGTEVFVGPQTAKTMAGFRKALAAPDAVVTVSGAAGTGKTTLVERALDAIGSKYKTIRVGRVRMNASDVLESLLIVLGVNERPSGTIQRFTALRKKLKDLQDNKTRVFIIVEDALRAGTETLAELEALTVGDAGESDGASIVLMGDERLFEYMKDPALAQLQQRIRQRHRIQPLCVAELRGYLKHSLRIAGGDFDQIFDARSAELVHELSGGIPRVANTLVDAVLVAAASQGLPQVSVKLIAAVAADEFGLSTEDFDFATPTDAAAPGDAVVADDPPGAAAVEEAVPAIDAEETTRDSDTPAERATVADAPLEASWAAADESTPAVAADNLAPASDSDAEQPSVLDMASASEPPVPADGTLPSVAAEQSASAGSAAAEPTQPVDEKPGETVEPGIVSADGEQDKPDALADIPHLIQDTLPDLAILSRRYEILAESDEETSPESETEPADVEIPELLPEPNAAPVDQDIPELTPDRTAAAATREPQKSAAAADVSEADPADADSPVRAQGSENDIAPNWKVAEDPEFQLVNEVVPALKEDSAQEHDVNVDAIPELKADADTGDIPELQVETNTAKETLSDTLSNSVAEAAADSGDLPKFETELASTAEPLPHAAAEEIPEWERDPTLAELKPDLDALEQAMAFTHGEEPPVIEKPADLEPEKLAAAVADAEELPEIILDKAIETGVDELEIEEPSDILPPASAAKSDPALDRIAADIANAKSLEDIDDIMAETLFGSGISMIAEQITANPPSGYSANDELELVVESPASPAPVEKGGAAPAAKNSALPRRSEITEEISIETRAPVTNHGPDLSASQRLKTVRALNADLHPSLREPETGSQSESSSGTGAPQPIEDQINTSITQTLQTLKIPPEAPADDDEGEQPKRGFLSRFRRS